MFLLPIHPELCCLTPNVDQGHTLQLSNSWQKKLRAPFSISEADVFNSLIRLRFAAADNVYFNITTGAQQTKFQSSITQWNPSDIRIGSQWSHPSEYWGVHVQTKLPNVGDNTLVATDETDFSALLFGQYTHEQHQFLIASGLVIWGDPLRFASQDDALIALLSYSLTHKYTQLNFGYAGSEQSPQNPPKRSLFLSGEVGKCYQFGAGGNLGISSFAPDWGIQLSLQRVLKPCGLNDSD